MKIKRFQKFLRRKNIDAAVIANLKNTDPSLYYFTGLELSYSFLIIPKKGNSVLLTNKLEYERSVRYSGIEKVVLFEKPAFEFLSKYLKKKTIGINKSIISLNAFREMKKYIKKKKYVDISEILLKSRQKKEPDEIRNLKKACIITDKIFAKLIKNFKFKTEAEIEAFLYKEAQNYGCTLSFSPIVASGKGGSMPHYRPKKVKLRKGFMIFDFGVNYNGYMSDISRTVYIGKPSKKEKEMYGMLLQVQKDAIKYVRPGMKAGKLMQFVKDSLGKYEEYFIHGLGHGVGVEIHELPSIHEESKDVFGIGDTFTIEPGVYFPGKYGIRIEDDILLTKKGKTVLTKSSKKLICLNKP